MKAKVKAKVNVKAKVKAKGKSRGKARKSKEKHIISRIKKVVQVVCQLNFDGVKHGISEVYKYECMLHD